MADLYFLISNPPHRDIDAEAVAKVLGGVTAEARMRTNVGVPEVWLADESVDTLKQQGAALMGAGAVVKILKGRMLLLVPPPDALRTFAFEDDALTGTTLSGRDVKLSYDARGILV